MNRHTLTRIAMGAAIVACLAGEPGASAHTGGITDTQHCDYGTRVTATLDDNVAPTSTWVIRVNGDVLRSGTGPGPRVVGPLNAHTRDAGTATLTIDFGGEHNVYTTTFPAVGRCHVQVTAPSASISPACGDPRISWTLHAGSHQHRFRIDATSFTGGPVTWYSTVGAHGTKVSAYHHLLGGSRVTVRSGGRVLASKTVEPAGQYPACRP